jgi:hypothetical protein
MTMEPSGTGRMVLSLIVLGALALAVWLTMEPGKYQQLTWLLLGFFALRVVLGWVRSRRMDVRSPHNGEQHEG